MFGSKKSNAAPAAPSWGDYKDTTVELLTVESATVESATVEAPAIEAPPAVEVPVQKIETGLTGKKAAAKAAREAKAAAKAATIAEKAATAPTIEAPAAPVSSTIADRKALFDKTTAETSIEDRKARVIELMSRPEGASLQELQTMYWLAAVAVRRIVEKAGYTTSQSEARPFRYFAKKA
jgi:hypothetical protein